MIEKYENCILNCDWLTLKEIMLKFAYFQELQLHLNEVKNPLLQQQLHYLITLLQYQITIKREALVLESGFVYFFFQKGIIRKRDCNAKSSKSIRSTKHKSWVNNNKGQSRAHYRKEGLVQEVDEYDAFDNLQMNRSRFDQTVYYNDTGRPTIVFYIQHDRIHPDLAQKMNMVRHEKIRFLKQLSHAVQLNKSKVQEHLHMFKLLKLQFGQILFSKAQRPQFVFFLKAGSVEISHNHKHSRAYVLDSPGVLALKQQSEETAKCVSQKVQCYIIKREDFQHFFQKHMQPNHRGRQQQQNTVNLTFPRVPFDSFIDKQSTKLSADLFQKDQKAPTPKLSKISERRYVHKSLEGVGEMEQKRKRRVILKRHFCNYYNDIYGQFSQRKIRQMGLDLSNQQNLKLYQIKLLHRKAPSMDQIKAKLKKVRFDKLHHLKQILQMDAQNTVKADCQS